MSYNEIAETFSEYSKVKSKNCQHLIELFEQAMIQMQEEEEIIQQLLCKWSTCFY